MAQWSFYGTKYSKKYKDIFKIQDFDHGLGRANFLSYRAMMAGAFLPRKPIKLTNLGQFNPAKVNERINKILTDIYGNNWRYHLDADMPLEEFNKDNARLLLMPHAKYYLDQAIAKEGLKKKFRKELSEIIKLLDDHDLETYDTVKKEVEEEYRRNKEKQLYLQMVRTGAIKERCKPNIGAYNDNVIGNIEHRIIELGRPAQEVVEEIADSTGLTVEFIRQKANKVLLTGVDSFDFGARNECYLALEAYHDNYEEKVKGLAWVANTTTKKFLRSIKGAKRELLKKARMYYVYHPMFYMPAEETQFSKNKKYTHGRIKMEKIKYAPAKKIKHIPQLEKRFSLAAFKRFVGRIGIALLMIVSGVTGDLRTICKYWKIGLFWAAVELLFIKSMIVSAIWWGIPLLLFLIMNIMGLPLIYNDEVFKKGFQKRRTDKRVRAAVLGMDPGVPVYTIDMLRSRTIPDKELVIIQGDAFIMPGNYCFFVCSPEARRDRKEDRRSRIIVAIDNHRNTLKQLYINEGLTHVTMIGMVRYDHGEFFLEGNPRKAIHFSDSKQTNTEAQKRALQNIASVLNET